MESIGPAGTMILLGVTILLFLVNTLFKAAFSKNIDQDFDSVFAMEEKEKLKLLRFYNKRNEIISLSADIFGFALSCFAGFFIIHLFSIYKERVWIPILATTLALFLAIFVGMTVFDALAKKYFAMFLKITGVLICPVMFLLYPFSALMILIGNSIIRLFKMEDLSEGDDVTEDEIMQMLTEGHEQGVIDAEEAEMINNIMELSETTAEDIMIPRTQIVAIDANLTIKEAEDFVLSNNNSRYPVYLDNLDHIIGILHMRDLMSVCRKPECENMRLRDIKGLLKDAFFVTEFRKIDDIFSDLKRDKKQIAIVIDEYAQTIGLLTMEDILEEIVGNIMDEYDKEESMISKRGDTYVIDGFTTLKEIEQELGIVFGTEEVDTLNGYMISKLEHIPQENEQFETYIDNYSFKIISVKNKVIKDVLVTKHTVEGEK